MGLYWTGLAALHARIASHAPVVVLMYHSVPCDKDARWIAPRNRMAPNHFERQMRFLARHRRVIGLAHLLNLIETGRPIPPGAVLLTFDDGYRDNLEIVAPILHRYGLPATLYLCTGYIGRCENQWADTLYASIVRRRRQWLVLDEQRTFDLRDPTDRSAAYATACARLLAADPPSRAALLKSIGEQLQPVGTPTRQTLSWAEVRRLAAEHPDVTLGVHTRDHRDLTVMSREDAAHEIACSVKEFEAELGYRPVHFSFPYSRWSEELCRQLPRMGIRSAMSGVGVVDQPRADPLSMRRLEAPPSQSALRYCTSGAHPRLSMKLFGRY